jgi:thiamine biosynthesis lipoprotein
MRCGSARRGRRRAPVWLAAVLSVPALAAGPAPLVTGQRYAMGTMFDVAVHHADRERAREAIDRALDEIERLDRVLSHFKADSDLSALTRTGGGGEFITVDPSLYDVLQEALVFSRLSGGAFDVTIGPLLSAWRAAVADGRAPEPGDITRARQCVGYDKIELKAPDRVRLRSACMQVDLGAIGKGFAVDRALAVLAAAGIRNALVNAGGSTIAAAGAPPGARGWAAELPGRVNGSRTLLLRDESLSTSSQQPVRLAHDPRPFGEILDPERATPLDGRSIVSVVAPRATVSDALSTTLLLIGAERGARLLGGFTDVAALWIAPSGELTAAYGASRMTLAPERQAP